MDRLDKLQNEFDEVDQQREEIFTKLEDENLNGFEWRELRKDLHKLDNRAGEIAKEMVEAGLIGPEAAEDEVLTDAIEGLGHEPEEINREEMKGTETEKLESEYDALKNEHTDLLTQMEQDIPQEDFEKKSATALELIRRMQIIERILLKRGLGYEE